MAYTTREAVATLDNYLGIDPSNKIIIEDTKERGFLLTLESGEKVVIFAYPIVHKQDNTKNYFDTRDSGAYERAVAWDYAIRNKLKYFCLGVNDAVDKYVGYIFSLECAEKVIEKISGTLSGARNGRGNQIIIPNDFIPSKPFERIENKLGIYIATINKSKLMEYLETYDNRPYMLDAYKEDLNASENTSNNEYLRAAEHMQKYVQIASFEIPDVREKVTSLYKYFQKRFSPEALLQLPDEKLLQSLFYTKESTNDSLCYWLEFNSDSREYCGSIAGGSAYKFGLFQRQEDGVWISGSPGKPQELTLEQALEIGKEIRQALVNGYLILENAGLVSLSDYEKLDDELQEGVGKKYWSLAWVHKYFSMMFPDELSGFHSSEWQRHVLYSLQICPSEKYYARSGQIARVAKYADWFYTEFFSVFKSMYGDIKRFIRLETSAGASHYGDEWYEQKIVAVGWNELGSLDNYVTNNNIDKKAIADKLHELYYKNDLRTASRKAGEIAAFYNSDPNTVFVMMDGYALLGLVDNIGTYYYEPSSPMAHQKKGEWHKCFEKEERMPNEAVGYQTTCYELPSESDVKDMIFLYKKYYYDVLLGGEDAMKTMEYKPLVFNTGIDIGKERNRIVFGAPGTGKSYKLKDDCKKYIENTDGEFERVTFHPDYTYSQFVGTYKPVSDSDDKIKYEFVPGPFMRVYVEALRSGRGENPQPYLLLIEEINRANVAAVFGDVFQLLDRDDDGVSEYSVQASKDVRRYLADELGGVPDNYKEIKLPDNMYIWATMNSADQGVFPMDTAFKRRWNFEYLGINNDEDKIAHLKITLGTGDNTQEIEWNVLRKAINDKLSKECKVNEDKLLGPFFIGLKILKTVSSEDYTIANREIFTETFKSKVLMYLFEDAAKQHKKDMFSGCDDPLKYSAICDNFDEIGINMFGSSFMDVYYNPQRG